MGRTLFPVATLEVTVRVVFPEILPKAAVMVEVPVATAVARPLLLTVATEALDEFQVTCVLISWLVPSENMPEAASCWVFPAGTLGLAGVTAIETSAAVGAPPPPPLPPHPVNSTKIKIIKRILLDFIDAHSRRD
jgi:hypothetical protein